MGSLLALGTGASILFMIIKAVLILLIGYIVINLVTGAVKKSLEKNPKIRIVLNCIALETLSEVTDILKRLPVTEPEFVLLQASRAEQIGSYHLMKGENPIYIISFEGKG